MAIGSFDPLSAARNACTVNNEGMIFSHPALILPDQTDFFLRIAYTCLDHTLAAHWRVSCSAETDRNARVKQKRTATQGSNNCRVFVLSHMTVKVYPTDPNLAVRK